MQVRLRVLGSRATCGIRTGVGGRGSGVGGRGSGVGGRGSGVGGRGSGVGGRGSGVGGRGSGVGGRGSGVGGRGSGVGGRGSGVGSRGGRVGRYLPTYAHLHGRTDTQTCKRTINARTRRHKMYAKDIQNNIGITRIVSEIKSKYRGDARTRTPTNYNLSEQTEFVICRIITTNSPEAVAKTLDLDLDLDHEVDSSTHS